MKRLVTIGDSITRGTYTDFGDDCPAHIASPCFAELVKEGLGFDELLNYGYNGVSISSTTRQNPQGAMSLGIDEMEIGDFAIVAGGTNDFGTDVELGTPTDKTDISFYGALDIFYKKLRERYRDKLLIITPIRRIQEKNAKGYTLEDYRKAIELRAKEYGFCVLDGYSVSIYPEKEEHRNAYILDGLHPNTAGHALYAEKIIEKIREMKILK